MHTHNIPTEFELKVKGSEVTGICSSQSVGLPLRPQITVSSILLFTLCKYTVHCIKTEQNTYTLTVLSGMLR